MVRFPRRSFFSFITDSMRQRLVRILLGTLLLAVAMYVEHTCVDMPMSRMLLIYLVPYLVVGYDIIGEAVVKLLHGKPLDEHLLMLIASLGVFGVGFFPGSSPELHEAVLVLLLFQVGEYFEHYAEHRSRESISMLLHMRHYTTRVEETADSGTSESETFIRRFARIYTPIVVGVAVVVAFVPPVFYDSYEAGLAVWLYRALTFLVVSCPCAFVISVPLTFFGGIGKASREGILMKGAYCIDLLASRSRRLVVATGTSSEAEIAAADVVIATGDESKLQLATSIARRTTSIARQNVAFAIGVKLLVLVLAAFGCTAMWMAVFADVGVTVLAVLNAMRTIS